MQVAFQQAVKAFKIGEVPIGAVIVKNNKIIAKAHNERNKKKLATYHAEILAINRACKKLKDWRLNGCELYVTLEPCPMCAGAIVNARLDKVIFGASDNSSSSSLFKQILSNNARLNHTTQCVGGVMKQECSELLSKFFKEKR